MSRQGLSEVVVDGESGAFEAGEALAQGGDPGVAPDGLGERLVPAALREGVARPGLSDSAFEHALVVARRADGRLPGGSQVGVGGVGGGAPHGEVGSQFGVFVFEEGLGPGRSGAGGFGGPGVGEVGDGGGVVEDPLVAGGQVGTPVQVVGEPCRDAGQPRQRPIGSGVLPVGAAGC